MKKLNENIYRIKQLMTIIENSKDINYEEDLDEEIELDEEGEESSADSSSSSSTNTTSSITPWESGVGRGPGNPITSAKREDKVTRSKGNPIGPTKWASNRTMGPTGKNYKI